MDLSKGKVEELDENNIVRKLVFIHNTYKDLSSKNYKVLTTLKNNMGEGN